MHHPPYVVLPSALLLLVSNLAAQSAPRPTVAAVAGCYALTLGPWEQQSAKAAGSPQILPPVIRLDTALAALGRGWRQLGPTPPYFLTERGPGIGPAWRVGPTDSVEAFWSTGFVGTRLRLAVRGDTLVGEANAFTDARGGPPDPFASARATRVSCAATMDTTATQRVLEAVYARLSDGLASAATASAPRPWRIELPTTDPTTWNAVRAHLMLALRARVPVASDSAVSVLAVRDVRISGDTLFARVTIGAEWRCMGMPAGSTTAYYLIGLWRGTGWEYPMREQHALAGDSIPCRR